MALSDDEIDYLTDSFQNLVEIDGCRTDDVCQAILTLPTQDFNAEWTIDGVEQAKSLFSMIRIPLIKAGRYLSPTVIMPLSR